MSGWTNASLSELEMTASSLNSSSNAEFPPSFKSERSKIPHSVILVGGVTVLSMIGNSLILILVCKSKEFRRPTNYMVGNLAAISIYRLLTFISAALNRRGWLQFTSQWTCKFYGLSQRACHPLEGFALAWLSIERSRIARSPWRKQTVEQVRNRVLSVWITAVAIQLPSLLFWNISKTHQLDTLEKNPTLPTFTCSNTKIIWGTYHAWLVALGIDLTFVILAPMLVLLKELLLLVVSLRFLRMSCVPSGENGSQKEVSRKNLTEDHVRLVRNAIAFSVLYITVNLPLGLWYTFYQTPPQYLPVPIRDFVIFSKSFFYTLAILHCGFFPLLVFSLSKNFRAHCKKQFRPGWA